MIINYRIDYVPQIHLPYRVMRYGGLQPDAVVRSFEYQGTAEDVLDICRQEAEEVKQLERTDTLNQIRAEIYRMLPMLDAVLQAGSDPRNVSLTQALEEIKRKLTAG